MFACSRLRRTRLFERLFVSPTGGPGEGAHDFEAISAIPVVVSGGKSGGIRCGDPWTLTHDAALECDSGVDVARWSVHQPHTRTLARIRSCTRCRSLLLVTVASATRNLPALSGGMPAKQHINLHVCMCIRMYAGMHACMYVKYIYIYLYRLCVPDHIGAYI